MTENQHVATTCATDEIVLKLNEPPKKFIFNIQGKWLIEMSENGIVFNRTEFPSFYAEEFVEEFINILERTFCIKFINKFDAERGYLQDNVTVEKSDMSDI